MDEALEYTGLMALGWDPLRGDTMAWEDRAFFLRVIREAGEPVLDVGCGTGRLLLDYLGEGIDIDGVEISPDMLAILRAKADHAGLDLDGRVHRAAMERFELPRRYQVVIVPSGSFQLVVNPVDAAAAMQHFFAHLEPGGTLTMAWLDVAFDHPDGAEDRFTKQAVLADGTMIRRTYVAWYDPAAELEHTDDVYERLRDGVVVDHERHIRSPATRHYPRPAIVAIHRAAGFETPRLLSVTTMQPAQPDDRIVMSVARRPGR